MKNEKNKNSNFVSFLLTLTKLDTQICSFFNKTIERKEKKKAKRSTIQFQAAKGNTNQLKSNPDFDLIEYSNLSFRVFGSL